MQKLVWLLWLPLFVAAAAVARLQEIKAGDFVTFPAGMDCVWDVKEAIHKHYNFH
jgi:uncharacterized cupin superfamily protein